ncbi:ChaN family lipoprotein [Petrachloros mirabilis]
MRLTAWLNFLMLMVLGACAVHTPAPALPVSSSQAGAWKEGNIIETTTGLIVPFDELLHRIDQEEVVYLGEEHHNHFHIDSALKILKHLTDTGRQPVLAMEMFSWDSQSVLDQYAGGRGLTKEEFVDRVFWKQNWGGPFEDYEPLVSMAETNHLHLVALNPPKHLVRSVARGGLSQARHDPEWARWGMQNETIVDDPVYRDRILHQLRSCHAGGSNEMYQAMYEASMVRDEGMARTIVASVRAIRGTNDLLAGPVVSYTGGGHIQFNLPVPKRVARRLDNHIQQMTIYMTSYEEGRLDDLREMINGQIADYVWLTPLAAQSPPRRCG